MPVEHDESGGRIFFSSTGRSLEDDDQIVVLSVGVDIGSSTSHLVFSRIVLERLDSRYVVTERETFYASDILLTPYSAENTIDADALGAFIRKEYADARVEPEEIDTGALILTGVAVQRANARAIGELFARASRQARRGVGRRQSGDRDGGLRLGRGGALDPRRMRGDERRRRRRHLEDRGVRRRQGDRRLPRSMSARASSASRRDGTILRDRGGGTAAFGRARARRSNLARRSSRSTRREPCAARWPTSCSRRCAAARPRRRASALLRTEPLQARHTIARIQFSGGVSEFISGNETKKFGDLGPLLAAEIRARLDGFCPHLEPSIEGIRATVVGASQYTVQLSGSTIFVVAARCAAAAQRAGDRAGAADRGRDHRPRRGRAGDAGHAQAPRPRGGEQPVAVFVPWQGSATFQRLDAFCKGVVEGLSGILKGGHPLVLAGDGDVGGLLGIHLHEEMKLANPVVSIDGLELKEFDYIDIGTMLESSGAVPVVIKSLIFPAAAPARTR